MKNTKIKSHLIIQQLFSFIPNKKKYKIIKYNKHLHQILDISNKDYQQVFIQKQINKYDFNYINFYWIKFKNNFQNIIKEDTYNLFLNALSNKINFNLKLSDNNFNLMINNSYFKNNIRVEIKKMNNELFTTILLFNIRLKEIFNLFSTKGKMSNAQLLSFVNLINRKDDEIKKLISYNKDGFLLFNEFLNYYYGLIKKNLNDIINDFNKLGYNDILKNKYNLNYLSTHSDELEKYIIIFNNYIQIINKKINKLCLYHQINKIIIGYFKQQNIFQNLKQLQISIKNFKLLMNFNIIFSNLQDLNIYINKNKKIKDLIDLIGNIKDSKIETLQIVYKYKDEEIKKEEDEEEDKEEENEEEDEDEDEEDEEDDDEVKYQNSKTDSKIILKNIKNLRIDGNDEILMKLYNFQFPNLINYQLNLNISKNNYNIERIINGNDYNLINNYLIMNNKFKLNNFVTISNKLKKIEYLKLNLGIFLFIYDGIKNKFEFILYDENKFKNYYLNYDFLLIDKISKYKKIKIEGLNKFKKYNNVEIIENKNIKLCDINFNIHKYEIKSFEEIRSIYCEEEIQNTNFIQVVENIINKNGFKTLKHINLTIGNNNLSNIYKYLSILIKNSKNLKSLILRFNSYNILNIFLLIDDLKHLKRINIKESNNKYNEEKILIEFPKLKERIYYLDEFKINDNNIIECIHEINENTLEEKIKLLNYIPQYNKDIQIFDNENEEMNEYFELYLNNKKKEFCLDYEFLNKGKYTIIIKNKIPLINMSYLFNNCFSLISLNLSNFNSNKVRDMNHMFYNCSSLTSLNLSNLNTNNVSNMSYMFYNCYYLISLNLSNFNTNKVRDMNHMFYNCFSLKSLNISHFNTNNVINMNYMFFNCTSLTYLNLFNFDTTNVRDMNHMFSNCTSLTSLHLFNFNTNNVSNMNFMFSDCYSLTSLDLSNFNTNNVRDMSYMFYNCTSLISLNISHFNTNNVSNMSYIFLNLNRNCNIISIDEKINEIK